MDECGCFVTAHTRWLQLLLCRVCGRDRRQEIDSDLLLYSYVRAIVVIGMRDLLYLNALIERRELLCQVAESL